MESNQLIVAVVVVFLVCCVCGRSISLILLSHILFRVSRRCLCFMYWALAYSSQGFEKVWTTVLAFSEVGRLRGRDASHFKWPFSCKCLVTCGSALDLNGVFWTAQVLTGSTWFTVSENHFKPRAEQLKIILRITSVTWCISVPLSSFCISYSRRSEWTSKQLWSHDNHYRGNMCSLRRNTCEVQEKMDRTGELTANGAQLDAFLFK